MHVFNRLDRGGAEMRFVEVLHRLDPDEFHIDVCVLSPEPGTLDSHVRDRGGEVVPLPWDVRFPLLFDRLLAARRYDVVHSHMLYASGPVLAVAALARVPMRIAHFRGMSDDRPDTRANRIRRAALRLLIGRAATHIVGCGEGAMDVVWHPGWRDDPRCRVIYNSVDPSRFDPQATGHEIRARLGVPADARLFLHVGNQLPVKNHERLLEIFAEILARAPSAWLVLAGSGTDDPNGTSARRARQLGVDTRVVALGVRDDVPRLLAAADALLLPSRHEGLPGVVLEACAAGVPVLATDLPGVREIACRLPLVRYLPLAAADAAWADAAANLPAEAASLRLRDTAAENFRSSVFHVDQAVEAYRALWTRQPVARPGGVAAEPARDGAAPCL